MNTNLLKLFLKKRHNMSLLKINNSIGFLVCRDRKNVMLIREKENDRIELIKLEFVEGVVC